MAAAVVAAATMAGCVHVRPTEKASFRLAEYFERHKEVPSAIAEEMRRGHVTPGMDQEQVFAVLGEPAWKVRHRRAGAPEVWIYPGHKIHQGYAHGASLYRLVFLEGRLLTLESL